MGFIPYAGLQTQMPIWTYLELSVSTCSYLELSGATWSYPELRAAIWSSLDLLIAMSTYLKLPGVIWRSLELSGLPPTQTKQSNCLPKSLTFVILGQLFADPKVIEKLISSKAHKISKMQRWMPRASILMTFDGIWTSIFDRIS